MCTSSRTRPGCEGPLKVSVFWWEISISAVRLRSSATVGTAAREQAREHSSPWISEKCSGWAMMNLFHALPGQDEVMPHALPGW